MNSHLTPAQVLAVQKSLNKKGFKGQNGKKLKEDGLFGINTAFAVINYKKSVGLAAREYVGPITYAKLTGDTSILGPAIPSPNDNPPWYNEALSMLGKHEIRDNAELAAWLASDGATVGDPADVPYCGDGVQTSLLRAFPGMKMPENPYLASSWSKWGLYVPPQRGSILSFWRETPQSWKGHVGFYAGESDSNYYVLGFNQGNMVSIAPISKSRLRYGGSRWPEGLNVPKPTGRTVRMTGGTVSTNEQ